MSRIVSEVRVFFYAVSLAMTVSFLYLFYMMTVLPGGYVMVGEHNPLVWMVEVVMFLAVFLAGGFLVYEDCVKE